MALQRVRVSAMAVCAGLLMASGCGDLLGFQHDVDDVQCNTSSECTGGPYKNLCSNSICEPSQSVGLAVDGDAGMGVQPATTDCVQIGISVCGSLTGLGLTVAGSILEGHYRFAVYDDNGGQPAARLAQTDEVSIQGPTSNFPVTPVVRVGCSNEDSYYWVCMAFDVSGFVVASSTSSSTLWETINQTADSAASWLEQGLPSPWTAGLSYVGNTPLLYFWIAP